MSERIIIEFDDEEKKPVPKSDKDENRIVIDFENEAEQNAEKDSGTIDVEPENIEPEKKEENYEEKIRNSKVNSFFKGTSHLSNFYDTSLKFPEGIHQGFRKKFSVNLKDEFFNSVLENNRYIILSSKAGSVYLIDRFTGKVSDKIFIENESFEKTGLVYENAIYLNSLQRIYRFKQDDEDNVKQEEIYHSPDGYYIWSNLNRYNNLIVFTEFNTSENKAFLKVINTESINPVYDYGINIKNFISGKICIADGNAYLLYDSSIIVYDLRTMTAKEHSPEINTDENSFLFYLNYRLYITTPLNELYYLDVPATNYKFKFTGIKNSYLNSIGGFADNIFTGTLDGWKLYKSSGLQVYGFEDEFENKIECISKNVLVISKNNKIVFCNLNRFQEAEGYVISSKDVNDPVEIVSAIISGNEVFVLTKNGILEVFTNDNINIHI